MPARDSAVAPLSAFWFGMQTVWGALLGISLQAMTVRLHPDGYIVAYGEVAALGALVAAVTQITTGIWSDRMRRRGGRRIALFVVGAGLGALSIGLFYASATFASLVVAFVLVELTLNIAIGPYQAIIPDYVIPSRAGTASAWMGAFQSAGNAVGAVVAAMVGSTAVKAASLVIVMLGSCAVTVFDVAGRPIRAVDDTRITVTRAATDLFVSRALLYLGFYTILGYMLFYLRDVVRVAAPATATGIIILIFTLAGVAGAALGGGNADRTDRRVVINAGNALVACCALLFIVAHAFVAVALAAAVAGFGWGIFLAADWALGCAILPLGAMATAMALWNLAVVGAQIVAPLCTTALITALHAAPALAPLLAFGLAAFELVAGSIWIWRIPAHAASPR